MDLTFQLPMQYCSLQHQTLLLSPNTSATGCCFCFGSISSFFMELFAHLSPVACWAPTDLGSSSFSVLYFYLSYCSWCSQGKNAEVVCHSLLQWTKCCQNSPPWPTCLGWHGVLVACCRVGGTEHGSTCMGSFEGGHHYLHHFHHNLALGK